VTTGSSFGRDAPRSVLDSVVLGAFNDGRGAADTVSDFLAPVDGIYSKPA
jgi:hypothetical protein